MVDVAGPQYDLWWPYDQLRADIEWWNLGASSGCLSGSEKYYLEMEMEEKDKSLAMGPASRQPMNLVFVAS